MSDAAPPSRRALACRDLGFACEWQIRSASPSEIESRFREHARCAHGLSALPPELAERVTSELRTA